MVKGVVLRTFGNFDVDANSNESAISHFDKGFAQQHFAEEVDINTIVKRFGLTGELPESFRAPVSGDFTDVVDYKTAMDAVRAADSAFMELPGELRAHFDNDPQKLVAFVSDAKNRDKAIELGLVPKPVEVARDGAPIAPVGEVKSV